MRTVVEWAGLIVAVAAALGVLYRYAISPVVRVVRQTSDFLEDWRGHPADDTRGIEERHGVMQRLYSIEREVKYNGGTVTLADAVRNLESGVGALEEGRKANAAGISHLAAKLDEQTSAAEEVRRDLHHYRAENTQRIDDLAQTVETHAADSAEFLGQALSELTNRGIRITPPFQTTNQPEESDGTGKDARP